MLGKRLYQLIESGLKMTGTYEPINTMPAFEEQLTISEYEMIEGFLQWCHDNDKSFGHGNYEDRFAEYQETLSDNDQITQESVQFGAVVVFPPDYTRQQAEEVIKSISDKIDHDYYCVNHSGEIERDIVQDFNPDCGGPVWYVP